MPALLTTASTLMCPHGGTVIASPGSTRAQAGAPILTATDSFTIAGCTFAPSSPHPCMTVQWILPAMRVKHGGNPVLNESSVGLCLAADQAPQGTVLIAATQPKASGL